MEILRLFKAGPRAVGEIAAEVDVSQRAASQHLAVLGKAGLVEARKSASGSQRAVAIRDLFPGRCRRLPEGLDKKTTGSVQNPEARASWGCRSR
ncbi:ArsR/SmtB family transcription factor [Sorangium sp. So ce854]|uniref:ArsR/SmtB family transcription factor n=1 Tax=Sorangium sp. So ce854 TaxID=3133322 RepID=UPI003F601E66